MNLTRYYIRNVLIDLRCLYEAEDPALNTRIMETEFELLKLARGYPYENTLPPRHDPA